MTADSGCLVEDIPFSVARFLLFPEHLTAAGERIELEEGEWFGAGQLLRLDRREPKFLFAMIVRGPDGSGYRMCETSVVEDVPEAVVGDIELQESWIRAGFGEDAQANSPRAPVDQPAGM